MPLARLPDESGVPVGMGNGQRGLRRRAKGVERRANTRDRHGTTTVLLRCCSGIAPGLLWCHPGG